MPKKYKPRSGSMAFYPRVKAKSIVPKFNSLPNTDNDTCKPICYYGIKVGMSQVSAKNAHKNSSSYGQEIVLPVSIIETPDLKVVGARLYKHNHPSSGKKAISELIVSDSLIEKLIKGKKSKKKKELDEFLKNKDNADDLVLLAYLNTKLTTIGQKKPVVVEVPLSGKYDDKINYLNDHFGKVISFKDTFDVDTYLDIKSVTKGHGFTGPVKRFGIRVQRPKHKKQRVVGSIGPWHPATVMYTVPRAGQHGFHNRITYNKKLLIVDDDPSKINPKQGFINYGVIKNNYAIVAGSVPGPSKRVVAFRKGNRPLRNSTNVTDVQIIK